MENLPPNKESPSIMLEQATLADLEVFMELEQSVRNPKTYPRSSTENEALDELTSSQVFFIKKDGKVVGNIGYQMQSEDHAEITGLMVDPRYQGQGIGREALTAVLDKLKRIKRIDLVTHPENEQALSLYESNGFHVESRVENYYGDGQPRLILVKVN
jgi:[ribosomal protein S18]-alanine N-acetyltransferase